MMELGNICFGNSRGQYGIPRGAGWEEIIIELINLLPNGEEMRSYGVDFENDTFFMMPYYWGDCECGYEAREYKWCDDNEHQEGCYALEYKKISHYDLWKEHDKWLENYIKPLYEKYGWDTESENWHFGCATRCSCNYKKKWGKFLEENHHAEDCKIIMPNFLYKPTGFEVQWYKYVFRDSYMNDNATLKQFAEIVNACVESLE